MDRWAESQTAPGGVDGRGIGRDRRAALCRLADRHTPAEIDITDAVHVERELRASVVPGVAVVLADMTQTKFCDSSGIRCLLRAHDVAAAAGAELRIAIHSDAVLRIFRVVGVDQLLNFVPGVEAALTDASVADRLPDEGPSSALAAQAPLYRRLVMRSRR